MNEIEPRQAAKAAQTPRGDLAIRVVPMPSDTNANGDIFGGWLLAQMDVAGGICAERRSAGRVATVAIESMTFLKPVFVGDVMCIYADLLRVGRSSMTYNVEAWVVRRDQPGREMVTEGVFTYVAVGGDRRPRSVPKLGVDERV